MGGQSRRRTRQDREYPGRLSLINRGLAPPAPAFLAKLRGYELRGDRTPAGGNEPTRGLTGQNLAEMEMKMKTSPLAGEATPPQEIQIEIRSRVADRQIFSNDTVAILKDLRQQAEAAAEAEAAPAPGGIQLGFVRRQGATASSATTNYLVWDAQGVHIRRLSQFHKDYRPLAGLALATCLDDAQLAALGRRWAGELPEGWEDTVYPDAYCTDRSIIFFVPSFSVKDGEFDEDRAIETFKRDFEASIEIVYRRGLSAHEEMQEIERLAPLIDLLIESEVRDVQECGGVTEEQSDALDHVTWRICRTAGG